jgi:hypothetical protein
VIDPVVATFTVVSIACGVAVMPAVRFVHATFLRIGGQRMEAGKCANCGQAWGHDVATGDAHLVEGQLVCQSCADRLRRRTRWAIVGAAIAAAAALAASSSFVISAYGTFGHLLSPLKLALLFAPSVAVSGLAGRAIVRMRRANQAALLGLGRARLLIAPDSSEGRGV